MTGHLPSSFVWTKEILASLNRHYHRNYHRYSVTSVLSTYTTAGDFIDLASYHRSLRRSRDDLSRFPLQSAAPPIHPRLFSSSSSSSSDTIEDHYEILGLGSEATQKEIKAAYIAKSKLYHPDSNPGKEKRAQENFIRVAAAYKTLSSRRHRSEYDVELENMLRAIRNDAPLTQEQVDAKLKDRGKYGFWNSILPYGSAASGYDRADEPNWKFMGRAVLYFTFGPLSVYSVMKFVEFTYGDILAKRRRTLARRERMKREIERLQKRDT